MLHTEIQGNQPSCLEEVLFKIFTTYEHGDHLGRVTWNNFLTLCLEVAYEIKKFKSN